MDRLYGKVDPLVDANARRSLENTQDTVADILGRRIASGESSNGKAVALVNEAITRPGGLTYQGVKDLRTRIGSYLDGSILPEAGTSMPELKQLYGSLTQDLRANVAANGPEALKAFDKANTIARQVAARRESLAKIVGVDANASPELVLQRLQNMAGTGSTANINRLTQARKAMGSDAWNEVTSAIFSRMGRDAQGFFSPERFLTAYGKISENGRRALFGSTGKEDLVNSINDIHTLSQGHQAIQRLANVSKTGNVVSTYAELTGLVRKPLKTLASLVGGRLIASSLAKPLTSRATSQWVRAYQNDALLQTPRSRASYVMASSRLAKAFKSVGGNPDVIQQQLNSTTPTKSEQE